MNRAHLQLLAEERNLDAGILLDAGRRSGAYYLSGYAVECGLKACIARLTKEFDFPAKDSVNRSFTHKFETLLDVAGLKDARDVELNASPAFRGYWLVVEIWTEQTRYALWSEAEARKIRKAVSDPSDGVLKWIKGHW